MGKEVQTGKKLLLKHLQVILGHEQGREVYRQVEETIDLIITATELEKYRETANLFDKAFEVEEKAAVACTHCRKKFHDPENQLSIEYTGECLTCDHITGESMD